MPSPQVPPHHRIAERIARLGRERGTLCHSLLIHGPVGAGQRKVAIRFAQSVFCETGQGPFAACGLCRSCRRVPLGEHPDLIWIEPQIKDKERVNAFIPGREGPAEEDRSYKEKKGFRYISIETIRDVQDRLVREPYEGTRVIGCLYEAEKMNLDAGNTLLKMVEEPPPHCLLIFVTEYFSRILPTIRSRCLHVPLGLPSLETLEEELHTRHEQSEEEARIYARYALQEGVPVDVALSLSSKQLREEALELVDLAVRGGEHAFIPLLKSLKHDRETNARLVQFCRDLLRDCLILAEGQSSGNHLAGVPAEAQSKLTEWASVLTPEALAELIDHSFEYEEAILGYASPVHSLAAFLSEVREKG